MNKICRYIFIKNRMHIVHLYIIYLYIFIIPIKKTIKSENLIYIPLTIMVVELLYLQTYFTNTFSVAV